MKVSKITKKKPYLWTEKSKIYQKSFEGKYFSNNPWLSIPECELLYKSLMKNKIIVFKTNFN